jgi:hypothetical protein
MPVPNGPSKSEIRAPISIRSLYSVIMFTTAMAASMSVTFVMALFTMFVGLLLPPITLPPSPLSVPFNLNRTRLNICRARLNMDRLWFHVGWLRLSVDRPELDINGGLLGARDADIDIYINASCHGRNSRHHQRSGSHDASGPSRVSPTASEIGSVALSPSISRQCQQASHAIHIFSSALICRVAHFGSC